jgi:lipopolysaccharide transport system ATP-binding protein
MATEDMATETAPADRPAIKVEGLTKSYRVYPRSLDVLRELISRRAMHQRFDALTDVSFSIAPGQIVGIVGRNGAGKSTLLRIIAGTLDPTRGTVKRNGRIAAILQLGTGFHPELTGRQNIYLGGMCLGMTRDEISARVDEIIDFSELGRFIDWPFKTYSTGMQSRLTFATATSVDPDILIVDEALSVGDARFQRKSFERIEAFRERGRTVLLVSHAPNVIVQFCDRALLLDHGRLVATGAPREVVDRYHRLLFATEAVGTAPETGVTEGTIPNEAGPGHSTAAPPPPSPPAPAQPAPAAPLIAHYRTDGYDPVARLANLELGTGAVRIRDAAILDGDGRPSVVLESGRSYSFWMRVVATTAVAEVVPGFLIKSVRGVDLYGWDSAWARVDGLKNLHQGATYDVMLDFINALANGCYFLTLGLADPASEKIDLRLDLLQFSVTGTDGSYTTSVVNLNGRLRVPSALGQ